MGDFGSLIIGVVDTFFAFFVVAPMMLQAASLFGVQKQFAKAMVQEGVVTQEAVDRIHPKKQIAGVLISVVVLGVYLHQVRAVGLHLRRRGAGGRYAEVSRAGAVQQRDGEALQEHLQGRDGREKVQ